MTQDRKSMRASGHGEGMITAIAFGTFFIIIGIMFVITPDLSGKIVNFFSDLEAVPYPPGTTGSNFMLPAPANPAAHSALYTAAMQFAIGIGILQIIIIALRLVLHSPVAKKSETLGNLIFWFGSAYLIMALLNQGTLVAWFEYWGALIMLLGITIVVRGLIHLAVRKK